MPYSIAPGDTLRIEFIFTDANGNPIDVSPAPTVDVFYTSTALAISNPVIDAACTRATPSKTGSYYYALIPALSVALGTAIRVEATTTDTNVPTAVRTLVKRFVVGYGVDTDAVSAAVWNRPTSLITTLGSIGRFLLDRLAALNVAAPVFSSYDIATQSLRLVRGDTYGGAVGDALEIPNRYANTDLTLASEITFAIFTSARNNQPLILVRKIGTPSQITTPTASKAIITLTSAQSRLLMKGGKYWHEAVAYFTTGAAQRTFSRGPVEVEDRYVIPGT